MSAQSLITRLPRLTLLFAGATFGLGVLYAIGQTDTLLILPVISGALTLILAVASAVFHQGARVAMAWSVAAIFVSLIVVGLLIPMT